MQNTILLKTGIIGTVISALCCCKPILVILLTAVGLFSLVGYLDIVLLLALATFLVIAAYAVWKRQTV